MFKNLFDWLKVRLKFRGAPAVNAVVDKGLDQVETQVEQQAGDAIVNVLESQVQNLTKE